MRAELDVTTLRPPSWPDRIHVRTFRSSDAASLHALLTHGYRHGGGSVQPLGRWVSETTTDAEFDPELVFLAESDGRLAGAAVCWTSAFVKDIVVHETWRGRGIGEALLRHIFGTFAARGHQAVELKVESSNLGALRLYERVGFRVIERLLPR
jgi:ribosomal protein S18 acetylase RimI-like enzyme